MVEMCHAVQSHVLFYVEYYYFSLKKIIANDGKYKQNKPVFVQIF